MAAVYAAAGANKQESMAYKQITAIQNSKQALLDADILAKANMPSLANSEYWAPQIAAAKARETARQAQIAALVSRLNPEEQSIIQASGVGTSGARAITMADIQAAAAKSGKSVEQVKADALAKGYVIQ